MPFIVKIEGQEPIKTMTRKGAKDAVRVHVLNKGNLDFKVWEDRSGDFYKYAQQFLP